MRDDIRLGEVAGRLEALRQLIEEFSVEVDLLVRRAVKRSHCRLCCTAARLIGPRICDQCRRRVATPKQAVPGVFRRGEHLQHEVARIGIERTLAGRSALLRLGNQPATATASAAKTAKGAQQEVADDENDDAADPEPAGDQWKQTAKASSAKSATTETHAAAAGDILEIAAFTLVAEPHRALLLQGRNA